jgi:hypothetical protein
MSLFKIRDFWSFDLNHLRKYSEQSDATTSSANDPTISSFVDEPTKDWAQFVVSVGKFSAVGEQDVFVCGNLEGHVYIIQVPESDQRKLVRDPSFRANPERESISSSSSSRQLSLQDIGERQLLAATNLNMSLTDLKCGYFTSALKQSIAVLGADKLVILTVKRRQLDLITGADMTDLKANNKSSPTGSLLFDENLMSHKLDEWISVDLLCNEFAYGLVIINNHADSSLSDTTGKQSINVASESKTKSDVGQSLYQRASKQVVQQLRLPQRDKIVVQYTNQFVFTLIDSKKVLGHFRIKDLPRPADDGVDKNSAQQHQNEALKTSKMSECFGCMPMAHLITGLKGLQSSLIISLSDHCIYSLPMDKLTGHARQNIVNRVALDLFSSSRSAKGSDLSQPTLLNQTMPATGPADDQQQPRFSNLIEIDVETLAEWKRELSGLLLQMQGLQRQARDALVPSSQREQFLVGQLLTMSRYSLDLVSSSGEHLWHYRFETPLICLHAYTVELPIRSTETPEAIDKTPASANQMRVGAADQHQKDVVPNEKNLANKQLVFDDQLVSIVCSDGFRDDRSNLMILKDDSMSWSAMLNSRPIQVNRLNLNRMSGLIATLDVKCGQLIASYLGTNHGQSTCDGSTSEGPEVTQNADGNQNLVVELERLDEPLFREDRQTSDDHKNDQLKRLLVANRIESGPSDGVVNVCTSISLQPNSTSLVHNIILTFEFDDLFKFDICNASNSVSFEQPARGVAEVQVGNCWPDRRDPLKIDVSFTLASAPAAKLVGVAAINRLNDNEQYQDAVTPRLMPKSLKVRQYLTFNETHSGILHQEQSFLLPISIVAQIRHVDYSSGHGQELNDVLDNLNGYQRATNNTNPPPYLYCDLFLGLKCDVITLLHHFVEGDLICRGRNKVDEGFDETNRRMETLESLNLLAQSLDCRIRFMSPTSPGMVRQSSEEFVHPIVTSFAFALKYDHMKSLNILYSETTNGGEYSDGDKMVWIHICDLSPLNESNIISDFISLHMRGWKSFKNAPSDARDHDKNSMDGCKSKVCIAIESQEPMAVVFALNHMLERVADLCLIDPRLGGRLIEKGQLDSQEDYISSKLMHGGNDLAISSNLNDALALILNVYETKHKPKLKQLQMELTKEFHRYQLLVDDSISISKRLPCLPDDMSGQLDQLVEQTKESHQKLMSILDELDALKKRDNELCKLPAESMIRIELPISSNLVAWSGLSSSLD